MKAEELMIGDWVYDAKADKKRRVVAEDFRSDFDRIMPVQLCPEILKQNGFGFVDEDDALGITHFYLGEECYCADMDLHIGTYGKRVFWLNHVNNSCYWLKYVHELQHAFRLFRINNEIEL